MLHKITTINRR